MSAACYVLAAIAGLFLAALLVRGAQRVWRHLASWSWHALAVSGLSIGALACSDDHECAPTTTVTADSGTGGGQTIAPGCPQAIEAMPFPAGYCPDLTESCETTTAQLGMQVPVAVCCDATDGGIANTATCSAPWQGCTWMFGAERIFCDPGGSNCGATQYADGGQPTLPIGNPTAWCCPADCQP